MLFAFATVPDDVKDKVIKDSALFIEVINAGAKVSAVLRTTRLPIAALSKTTGPSAYFSTLFKTIGMSETSGLVWMLHSNPGEPIRYEQPAQYPV